jgi:hypothetical protein
MVLRFRAFSADEAKLLLSIPPAQPFPIALIFLSHSIVYDPCNSTVWPPVPALLLWPH